MTFKYKTTKEVSEMTPEQVDIYSEQKREFEAESTQKMIADAIAKAFPAKTDDEVKAEATAAKAASDAFEALKEEVQQLKENNSGEPKAGDIAKELKENKDAIKGLAKRESNKEVTLKAATVRASVATANVGGNIPGIGQLGYIERSFYDVCTKVQLSNNNDTGVVPYTDWDEDTTVRAAAARAENSAFPESTAKFKGYTLAIQKIGDTLPVSEEFFEDEALAAGELKTFLQVNVQTAVDDELINGDNTGAHLKGLIASTPAYSLPASGDVVDANIYDLITKVITSITSTRGSKYKKFNAVMNKSTIDRLILKKDANNNYQFPPNHPVYSMIVEDNNVDDNVMVVGDFRYAKIYEKVGVTLSQGTVSTQFTEDMMTLKARTRLCFLIRTVDQTGFAKVTDIDAALTAITAV